MGDQSDVAGRSDGRSVARLAIDLALVATLAGTLFLAEIVVWFHLVFLVVTIAAFSFDVRPFLVRAVPALVIVTSALVYDWQRDALPFDEVLELPILAAVAALINVVAVRRARLAREVERSGATLQRLRQARFADLQDRQLFDLSLESTSWLTASATHDLNNILATILASNESIAESHPTTAADDTAQIEHAVEAARQLVGGIAELIGTGNVDSWCDLHEVVDDTLDLHVPTGGATYEVELGLEALDPRIHLPRVLAYQLVANLIVNAVAAMPDGGRLAVRTANGESPPTVELTVADTGEGMADSVRDHAFEPHFSTRAAGGGGLGLYTVGRIVDAAGGSIDLVTRVGEGTAVTVGLPGGTERPVRAPRAPASRQARVMLVEDEPRLRERWSAAMQAHGYRVVSAGDAGAALVCADEEQAGPEVLVTDYAMPGMDGLELIETLRRTFPHLPAVLVSGLLPELPAGWSAEPMNRFVAKPCSVTQLLDAIEDLLGQPLPSGGAGLVGR